MDIPLALFLPLLAVVALLYASVGHGGASGYLALMALFSFAPETMKPTALLLNLIVAGVSFLYYYRARHFRASLFWPFAATSIPCAMLGGALHVEPSIYKLILAAFLLFSAVRMIVRRSGGRAEEDLPIRQATLRLALPVGAVIGFLSGLIGIGGGVILSPVILLLRWGRMKETAAVSALFIWVNSAAGLIGGKIHGALALQGVWTFALAAAAGGILGGYWGSRRLNAVQLRLLLGVVLALAAVKLALY